jgi:hypothetical protein
MNLAVMQPYLFPYVGYWQLINAVDTFVIYDDVNYIKQGWINRNYILLNGQKHRFTLEAIGGSSNRLINEVKVGKNKDDLLKTIEVNYGKAPYFNKVHSIIKDIFNFEDENLARFVGNSLIQISDYFGIDTDLIYSSEIEKKTTLKGQEKIRDICKSLGADKYINAIGGQDLYDKDSFSREGLGLYFINMLPFEYKQFDNKFIPNLSIIDVIMFNSKKDIKQFLNMYELI